MNQSAKGEITMEMMRGHLYSAVVSDALDAVGLRNQSPRIALPAMSGGERLLVGRAKTTLWVEMDHEDPKPYELELKAVDSCRPGEVFVGAAQGSMHSALWGELLTTASMNSGCIGAVIDGAVRDLTKIRRMNFPLFARGSSVYDSQNRHRVVDIDVPVNIGGVRFCSGDLVFADVDGVVVVPAKVEQEVVRRAWEKVHAENVTRDAIRGGMKATEAYKKFGVL